MRISKLSADVFEVYHLTRIENLESIQRRGLRPEFGMGRASKRPVKEWPIRHPEYYSIRKELTDLFESVRPYSVRVSRRNANFFYCIPARENPVASDYFRHIAHGDNTLGVVATDVTSDTSVFDANLFGQACLDYLESDRSSASKTRAREFAERYWTETTTIEDLCSNYEIQVATDQVGPNLLRHIIHFHYLGHDSGHPSTIRQPEILINGTLNPNKIRLFMA